MDLIFVWFLTQSYAIWHFNEVTEKPNFSILVCRKVGLLNIVEKTGAVPLLLVCLLN